MNEALLQACSLTPAQQAAIREGIRKGYAEYEECLAGLPDTPTNNYKPKLRGDIINRAIEQEALLAPAAGLTVERKKASFYEYIVLRDNARSISVLIHHLPESREMLPPSRYRGEFAMYNIDRLVSEGFLDVDVEQLELELDDFNQASLPMEPAYFQFCVVICYDGTKGADGKIYEGALAPNQNKWIYRKDITEAGERSAEPATTVPEPPLPKLRPEFAEERAYGLKLKQAE